MFTITPEQMRHLAEEPHALGMMLFRLLVPYGPTSESLDFEPQNGWTRCDPGPVAADRFGDAQMQGYADASGTVIVTVADEFGAIRFHAEGDGWAIENDSIYGGWEASGFYKDRTPPRTPRPKPIPRPVPEEFVPPAFARGVDLSLAGYTDKAHWLRPDFDWDEQIRNEPGTTLSRMTVLARLVGAKWAEFIDNPRPHGAMMHRIEQALGIDTSDPDTVHHLPLGRRLTEAEAIAKIR